MNSPEIHQQGGIYQLTWQEGIAAQVTRLREHRDGRVTAELTVTTSLPGYQPYLAQSLFNLSSIRSRTEMAKTLTGRCSVIGWEEALEQLCFIILQMLRRGEPIKEIWTSDDIRPLQYLLYPLIPLNMPTTIYGEGGTGKSYLALLFATCVQLPWYDNPLCLKPREAPTNVIYLDYESDEDEIAWRLKCLKKGMGLPELQLQYRHCSIPFADDLETIQQAIVETKTKAIIVDSLGVACGGDLNSAETANRFNNALRQVNVTSLLLTHTAKDITVKRKTIFGSVYFYNNARSVWEVRKSQEPGGNEIHLGLYNTKFNPGKLHPPIGFKVEFGEDYSIFSPEDIREVPELARSLPLRTQIIGLLNQGKMPVKDIADELDASESSIRTILNRDKKNFVKAGKEWALLSWQS